MPIASPHLIPLLGAAATPAGIARRTTGCGRLREGSAAHPLTPCSQGETRVSNRTPLLAAGPHVAYDCDVDWTCGAGLGIALDD